MSSSVIVNGSKESPSSIHFAPCDQLSESLVCMGHRPHLHWYSSAYIAEAYAAVNAVAACGARFVAG